MKNFIDWLTEEFNNEDDGKWTKDEVVEHLNRMYETIISSLDDKWEGKHYGDCTKQNVSCTFCEFQNYLDAYEKYSKS